MSHFIQRRLKEQDLVEFAKEVLQALGDCRIVLLSGQMGSGKTSFTKALCSILACSEQASSPTFSIISQYDVKTDNVPFDTVYHMDLYRLNQLQQLIDLGLEDQFFSGQLCIIEWPELAKELLRPNEYCEIEIEVLSDQERSFTFNCASVP